MKKIILLLVIMTIAVFCSACINNYAVMQLNNFAKTYSDRGEFDKAISRLEASVDLDGSIYESRYNLAVAYYDSNQCEKAYEQANTAKKLVKNEPSLLYLEGNINTCLAKKIFKDNAEKTEYDDPQVAQYVDEIKKAEKYIYHLNKAVEAYQHYVEIASINDRNPEIVKRINDYRAEIESYKVKYNL